ncbi:hypothetical protein TNCT_25681 [Trichonephila clavata]|uniref:Uncharacterized protein n=1 Tax=Trichonephila clavata TaxID=2740835 RepID=A0A8X6KZ37_TRICU|nr:hypothetical protein TNCT_25681 [Trichonephila clavata]
MLDVTEIPGSHPIRASYNSKRCLTGYDIDSITVHDIHCKTSSLRRTTVNESRSRWKYNCNQSNEGTQPTTHADLHIKGTVHKKYGTVAILKQELLTNYEC